VPSFSLIVDVIDGVHSSAIPTQKGSRSTQQCLCRTVKLRMLATLLDINSAAHTHPRIIEAHHALDRLGAVGIGCLSNHEGRYLGNKQITPFFAALDARNSSKEIIYIHPTEPVLTLNGTLISANPSKPIVDAHTRILTPTSPLRQRSRGILLRNRPYNYGPYPHPNDPQFHVSQFCDPARRRSFSSNRRPLHQVLARTRGPSEGSVQDALLVGFRRADVFCSNQGVVGV